ncbi:MAG: LacI family DNA-binding transcriptional regulator [Acidobacteriota bacterium]|nr:LacI family DNA-binding transcriptional regulator [Acidobacteriota bacterium]
MTPKPRRSRKRSKSPNIYDVAAEARVSVYTVSAVINRSARVSETLRRRVEEAIHKLHYRPNLLARGLAKRQTHTIGMIVPDIANPFFPLVVRGAEDTAQKSGYSILLCNSDNQHEKEETYLELLLSKQVDGILLTKAPGSLPPALKRLLSKSKIPVVLIMRTVPGLKADAAVTDDLKGAFEAVSHLARIGYRRIGLIGGPLNVSNGATRFQGYRKALKEYGLPFDSTLIAEGDYRVDSGYRAGLAILPRRPDAVFVANYLMTVGFMQAADEMGMKCPEDFGLVSFDDYPWLRCFRPRLTTVDLPKYELGVAAASQLLLRLGGKAGPPAIEKLAPQLRVRESCGFSQRKQGVEAHEPV